MSLENKNHKSQNTLSGWGLYPRIKAIKKTPRNLNDLINLINSDTLIARGNGRSYGDCAINQRNTIDMRKFNRFLDFNEKKGLLTVQSGVLLKDVLDIFIPKGWFPAVTPGTKYVTIGGMVATDVHGKNHLRDGTFSKYIEWIEIISNDGQIIKCSRDENAELFSWTIGGMGLTGVIINVAFFLKPIKTAWITQRRFVAKNINELFELFESNLHSKYSVAWIDCYAKGNNLGRSVLMLGEHTEKKEINISNRRNPLKISEKIKFSIPFFLPSFFFNNKSVKIFNMLNFNLSKITNGNKIIDWDSFFYPLDKILNWNKIYGSKGFAQFQCVIPLSNSRKGITELLKCISSSKTSSFLAVLKRFGKHENQFSFPMEGYSLALDFPINNKNLLIMNYLDEITIKNGGRFYLAKDSRLNKNTYKKSDKRIQKYKSYRKNDYKKFISCQSKRLGL